MIYKEANDEKEEARKQLEKYREDQHTKKNNNKAVAVGGATALGTNLGAVGLLAAMPEKAIKGAGAEDLAKKLNVGKHSVVGPDELSFRRLSKLQKKLGYGATDMPLLGKVVVAPGKDSAFLGHEFGHISGKSLISRPGGMAAYQLSKGLGNLAGLAAAPVVAHNVSKAYSASTKEEKKKYKRNAALAASTGALIGAPHLIEEARASKRGISAIKQLAGKKEALKALGKVVPAWASYGAVPIGLPVATYVAANKLNKKRRDGNMDKVAMYEEMIYKEAKKFETDEVQFGSDRVIPLLKNTGHAIAGALPGAALAAAGGAKLNPTMLVGGQALAYAGGVANAMRASNARLNKLHQENIGEAPDSTSKTKATVSPLIPYVGGGVWNPETIVKTKMREKRIAELENKLK
jgi:hypothetical protein